MPLDRKLWAETFTDALPQWQCSRCKKGYLSIEAAGLRIEETGPSKAARKHDAWEPEWIENRFVGFLTCSYPGCQDLAAVCGSSSVDYFQVDWDEYDESVYLRVAAITPAPILINIPDNTPEPIVEAIGRASSLVWSSLESAANQLRQAVEL